jgi:DNA polymerase III subunit delta'
MARALQAAGTEGSDPAALAELSGGSVGAAIRLANQDGLALYADLVALAGSLPRLDRPRALKLADSVTGKGNEERLDLA